MGNLGAMAPETLLELAAGSATCAFAIFVFIIGYYFVSRAGKKGREKTSRGIGTYRQPTSLAEDYKGVGRAPLDPATGALSGVASAKGASVDVSARLAGTGRDAWLQEAPLESSPGQESSLFSGEEVLRIVRDTGAGHVWIKVAAVQYRSLNEIRDRAVGERVLAAITQVLRFSNGMVATDQGLAQLNLPPCDAVKVPSAVGTLSDASEPGEILRLISNPDLNDFSIQVAGRRYHRLTDVNDRAIGQCILEGATHLLQFSNGMLATNDGLRVIQVPSLSLEGCTSPPALSIASSASQQPDTSESSLLSEQDRFLRQLMSQTPLTEPEKTVERPSLMGSIRRMRKSTVDEIPLFSLPEEIDRIFQGKLAISSRAGADVQVEAGSDGGVRIRVGTAYYATPDEVPDAELRGILKRSIAEWEQS